MDKESLDEKDNLGHYCVYYEKILQRYRLNLALLRYKEAHPTTSSAGFATRQNPFFLFRNDSDKRKQLGWNPYGLHPSCFAIVFLPGLRIG